MSGWPDRREVRDTGIMVRSGIEEQFAERLLDEGIDFEYESETVEDVSGNIRYTPDFFIGSNVVVELKGRATGSDVAKGRIFEENFPDVEYIVVGDTDIEDIPADAHFDFDTGMDDAIEYINEVQE